MAKKGKGDSESPSEEFKAFEEFARKIMQVPKEEIDKAEEEEWKEKEESGKDRQRKK